MYIAPLKTLLVESLAETFDNSYPVTEFRGVHVDLEYPVDKQMYPSIWVDYDDTQPLLKAGVAHQETAHPVTGTEVAPFTRWRFQGYVSLTTVAMTSLERDRLFDEMIRVVAFGNEDSIVGRFKNRIANNDLIAANLDTDKIEARGSAAAPGTPWGTDELMYERTLNLGILGEFVPDPGTGVLIPLSKILTIPVEVLPGSPDDWDVSGYGAPGQTAWH